MRRATVSYLQWPRPWNICLFIKHHAGGIKRSSTYRDRSLSWRKSRAAFPCLDLGWDKGRGMDEIAGCIGGEWAWYGIRGEADLWGWMQRTRRC